MSANTQRLHPDDLLALAELVKQLVPPAEPAPALLDTAQAAELLAVPKSWVAAEARAGRIPHVPLGRYVRFERAELETWWKSRAREARVRARSGAGSEPTSSGGDRR